MKKSIKILLISLCSFIIVLGMILGISFAVLTRKTNRINDDFSFIYTDEKYTNAVGVEGVQGITQEISCGYAVIEMFSKWNGGTITEQNLFDKYGKVITSTGKSFCNELNKQFPEYQTEIYKYLKNSELIDKVYKSLADGIPVPFEWAAKYEDKWTLHYSLVIRLDIPNDTITVANPYGYIEYLTIK
ncbi:MAG: hypothetical protein K2J93_00370, partial [Anaeroplasmataceae bacterium]|nr:hypothetical protein [Anaeroplasmataceae bacterium]